MSEYEQGKQGPEAIITRKPKSMKISWVQILGREHFLKYFLYKFFSIYAHLLAGSHPTLA